MTRLIPKMGIIGTVGVPAKYGGFETLAHHLVLNLSDKIDITVYNSTKHYPEEERVTHWNGAAIKYIPIGPNGLQSVLYDFVAMIHAAIYCDILLILGVSGCMFLPVIKLLFPYKKIIVNIDGIEWRRPKWNTFAKRFLLFSEKMAVKYANDIIADNAAIQKYAFERYGISSILIEYGADHNAKEEIKKSTIQKYSFLQKDYAFKVARIEPDNNLHLILDAFESEEQIELVIIGNWNHSEYGKALKEKYSSLKHFHLLDPIYDPSLLNQIRSNAKVYVHGHGAGGTNPSLVEAMYLGLPILCYEVIYNEITTEFKAIYFKDKEELRTLVQDLDSLNLNSVAKRLTEVAQRRYCWSVIAQKYAELAEGKVKQPRLVFDFELPLQLQEAIRYN